MAVEAAKDPMQFGNAQRCADARAGGIFDYAAGKMSLSQAGIEGEPVGGFELILDRKSTRLNSSHEWISYAVFCLKKKKEKFSVEVKYKNRPDGGIMA